MKGAMFEKICSFKLIKTFFFIVSVSHLLLLKNMHIEVRLIGHSKLPAGVNVSVEGCLSALR